MERECNFAAAAACICPAFGIGIEPQRCPDYEERRNDPDEM